MKRSFLKILIALFVTVSVNGALAVGMAFWTGFGDAPRKAKAPPSVIERPIIKREPPKKKKPQKKARTKTVEASAAPLPVLNLPSAVTVPVFEAEDKKTAAVLHPSVQKDKTILSPNAVLTEDMLDESPKPTLRTPFRYPKGAEQEGIEGEVTARLLLDVDGSVLKVKILSAEPPGVFDDAAEEALYTWRFTPATFRGRRLKAWVRQRAVFRLH
jgi:periplasmic protein TonB